jgi:hypothetical protein
LTPHSYFASLVRILGHALLARPWESAWRTFWSLRVVSFWIRVQGARSHACSSLHISGADDDDSKEKLSYIKKLGLDYVVNNATSPIIAEKFKVYDILQSLRELKDDDKITQEFANEFYFNILKS